MKFAAVLLAAGAGRRMGQGNKLLLPMGLDQGDPRPMVRHVFDAVLASRVAEIRVVLGYDHVQVGEALHFDRAPSSVRFVVNDRPVQGMGSSLACGLDALGSGLDGVVVCLGDMPYVTGTLIDRLCTSFQPGDFGAVPVWHGRWGNPALLSQELVGMLRRGDGGVLGSDRGARALLEANRMRVRKVPAPSDAVLRDIDRPEDR